MNQDEVAVQIAHQVFDGLGFQATLEQLNHSFLALAWASGTRSPKAAGADPAENPWSRVTIRYHYEEALALRFWALEAELLFGFITKIMRLAETELGLPVKASGITPAHVLRAMTQWSLARAGRRARIVGSPGILSVEEATAIFNSRVVRYEALIDASVKNLDPIPTSGFQLGLSREHPWTAPICYIADNICDALELDTEQRVLMTVILQLVVSAKRTALYNGIKDIL